jgi:hypothetical protein
VALVRTDVSEKSIASIIRVTIVGELGTNLAITSKRSAAHFQKTAFFIVIAVRTLNLTCSVCLRQVGLGVTSVIGGVCLFVLVHWAGKRKLSLVALAGSAVCCFVIAVYSYVVPRPESVTNQSVPWVPLATVVMLAFFNSLFFYIPWNWLSEIFPFR